jgi:type III pantothenate kinase
VSRALVVDVGNTTTRVGFWDGEQVGQVQAGRTAEISIVADVEALAAPLLEEDLDPEGHEIAVCSVVPQAEALWLEWAAVSGLAAFVLSGRTPTPLENRYAQPDQLGPDRLAAAVGAARRVGTPVVVVSLGTATVVDLVSVEGRFLGGAIAAGVETGLWALAERTAGLPRMALSEPERVFGADTGRCLLAGAVHGTAALVEGIVARFQEVLGAAAPVAVTGGSARLVAPHLRVDHQVFPNLVLEGLGAIWECNRGAE